MHLGPVFRQLMWGVPVPEVCRLLQHVPFQVNFCSQAVFSVFLLAFLYVTQDVRELHEGLGNILGVIGPAAGTTSMLA